MAEFKIYGPGSSSGSPVYQEVACSETSTDIYFTVSSSTRVDDCFTDTIFKKEHITVELPSPLSADCSCVSADTEPVLMSGETSWGETVWYKIKQIRDICPQEDPTTPTSRTCDIGNYWINQGCEISAKTEPESEEEGILYYPSTGGDINFLSVENLIVTYEHLDIDDYGMYVDIHKSICAETTSCGEKICEVIPRTEPIKNEGGKLYYSNKGGKIEFSKKEKIEPITIVTKDCPGKSITFTYECHSDETDECSGTSYNIKSISFDPSYIDYMGGSVSVTITYEKVEKNPDCSETKTNSTLKTITGISECIGEDCYRDHYVDIPLTSLTVSLTDGDLYYNGRKVNNNTSITYLQLGKEHEDEDCGNYERTYCVDGNVKVYYETYIDGSYQWITGGEVSEDGGYIKVSWDYTMYETPSNPGPDCQTRSASTTWTTDAMYVSPCPGNTTTSEFTGEILFKKQTPECSYPSEVVDDIKMNKIIYTVTQECHCTPYSTVEIIPLEVNVEKCESFVSGNEEIGYPQEITTTWDENCESSVTSADVTTQSFVFGENNTNEPRDISNGYFIVHQAEGPCHENKCACDTFAFLTAPPDEKLCDELEFTFEDVYVDGCSVVSSVTIPYYGTCNGIVQVSGELTWNDNFVCDKQSHPTIHTYTFPADGGKPWSGKTIRVIQCSDGTDDCGCDYECE